MSKHTRSIRFPVFVGIKNEKELILASAFIHLPATVPVLDQHNPDLVICNSEVHLAGNTIICEAELPFQYYDRFVGIGFKTVSDTVKNGQRIVDEAEIFEVSVLLAPNPYEPADIISDLIIP
jgi:hypothetical protein